MSKWKRKRKTTKRTKATNDHHLAMAISCCAGKSPIVQIVHLAAVKQSSILLLLSGHCEAYGLVY
jgi:hypothetical protein